MHGHIPDTEAVVCHVQTSQGDWPYIAFRHVEGEVGVECLRQRGQQKGISQRYAKTYTTGNDLLMDHSSMLALTVKPTAWEILECSARVSEAADSFQIRCFGVEHRSVECDVGISGADVQCVGLAGDEWSAAQCGDHDSLLDRRDLVDGIVFEFEGS